MTQYPDGLFKSVALNLLKKSNKQEESHALAKLAADYSSPDELRSQFLKQHQIQAGDFKGDPEANRFVDQRINASKKQLNDFYAKQRESGMYTPQMETAQQKALKAIESQKDGAALRYSIDRTRKVAEKDPERFQNFRSLSEQSQNALGQSHGKEIGATLGAAAGAGLGMLAGKKLPKNSKGILQQVGGALAGGTAGGFTGGAIGSNRDEKRTGFNHEDVMKPYEIASRMNNQSQFR